MPESPLTKPNFPREVLTGGGCVVDGVLDGIPWVIVRGDPPLVVQTEKRTYTVTYHVGNEWQMDSIQIEATEQ